MVLENFVRIETCRRVCVKIEECAIQEVVVRDPLWGRPMPKRRLACLVSQEDGRPVAKVLSTLSEKLALQLWELYRAGVTREHIVCIHKRGEGFAAEFEVEVL